ncbi:ABC transporter ATP-binding protein [Pelagicoccus sp. SDUM812002]|uniref:ABC transporter ATP-binding protein n=1 Tax=Pelagicoccus sp. SDUM812002 TaxID=3041266 RepID=UPI00280D33DA|nr:ABC transporter ATP-binding protein [Pelagicoccus sp. SDUM812002]MDQ8188243.1 ABC transporter ATP-binding protein [Pelagicoccus sp. SDUM812002]
MTLKLHDDSGKTLSGPKLVWTLISGFRSMYLWAALALFASTAFQFVVPLIGSATIDYVLTDESDYEEPLLKLVMKLIGGAELVTDNLWVPAVAMLVFAALGGLFNYYQKLAAAKASDGICKRLKDQLYNHIQRMSNRHLDQTQTGDLVQRCTSDVETTRIFLAAHIVEIGRGLILIVTVLPIMLSMHVGLTIASMALIPVIILYSYLYIKKVKHLFTEVDEAEGRLTSVVQENITGIRVVRAFGRHDFEIEKFEKPNSEYRDSSIKLINIMAWFWSVADIASLTQIGIALIASTYLALQGTVSIGTIFAFLALLNMVLWPVRMIGRILTDFGKTAVALQRINEILSEPFETEGDEIKLAPEEPVSGRIEFKNVSFAHDKSDPTVEGINLCVEPGETLAILGPSGSGKTTLMHLLLRFYDCNSGEVKLDGMDIKELDRAFLRAQFGVVLQEPFLYSRSIRSNIQFGVNDAQQADIEKAANMACIHDTIRGFSDGYDTEIGEKGITLSGGQRQRVAISRALLRNPPILLLDDALSAVDNETESSIIGALQKRHGKQTTIVIAHRLSTLAHADKIVVLENGKITQSGTHDSLTHEDGLYRRLWTIQTQLEANLAAETNR